MKNIARVAGRPLVYWTAKACSDSRSISQTFVASDDELIRTCVEDLGLPHVTAIDRDPSTATDEATTESALLEFAEKHDFDHCLLVQPTSPLLTSSDIDGAIEQYIASGADSLVSVVRTKRFFWEGEGKFVKPENYDPVRRPRRQDWGGQLVENGAMYMTSRNQLLKTRCRISGKIVAYEMPEETYLEVDEKDQWSIMEQLLLNRQRGREAFIPKPKALKLFAVDVDGTLTDGGMYYSPEGEVMKRFDTRDAFGMNLLRKGGIVLALTTAEDSPIVLARARKLCIEHVYIDVKDKVALFEELLADLGLSWKNLAYVGDDLNDLAVLERCGFSACPHDATEAVRRAVNYVCRNPGGHGAVREVCDLIRGALAGETSTVADAESETRA